MKERYPYGTFSGLSVPAQEVQAEARSPPPGDTEDVYNGGQSHLSPPHPTLVRVPGRGWQVHHSQSWAGTG